MLAMTSRALLLAFLLLGCGTTTPGGDAGGMDSGASDAGDADAGPGDDAGDTDAGPGDDAGDTDAGPGDDAGSDGGGADAGIDCSMIGCGAPVFCGATCDAPCGCCPCGASDTRCDGDDLITCPAGCYERTPCGAGMCVTSSSGSSCSSSSDCATLEAAYLSLVGASSMTCSAPGMCHILIGHCGVGLGGCSYALNTGVTQADLDAIAAAWTASGCDVGRPVCGCPPPPTSVRCDAGGCLAR